ncbi:MAG: adenylate/guanylate cyclase domain-containing protein [Oscillatoriales cyanobacterium C42_A2020_001]|nr:adenylate/guanylate cyclase domain-containing protein [Leptolyngbyaceae cyanobacterium C42_A2020_001]
MIFKRIWEWRGIWTTVPTAAGLVILLRLSGALQPYEWMAFDQLMRSRPSEAADPRIVIVGVNEDDLRKTRRWPLDDATLARLIQRIKQQQPVAIGLDLYRDFPVEPGHSELVNLFKTTPNLIGIENRGGIKNVPVAPPPVLKQLNQVASNDVVQDGDGKVRRVILFIGEDAQETLGLRLARLYLEKQNILAEADPATDYLKFKQAVFPKFQANDGAYIKADDGEYQILLNYRGPANSFQTVSLMEVLNGNIPANLMRDRIVLIGPTATSIKDFFYTPYSGNSITTPETMAGVEIQANLASQILSSTLDGRTGIQGWQDWQEMVWIIAWATVGTILAWSARAPRWAIGGILLLASSLVAASYLAFLAGWWIPIVPAVLALLTSTGLITSYIAYLEHAERQTIMNIFGRHVSPKIAEAIWRDRDQLLQQGRLTGRRMTATVLFSDIKDFTTVSERTSPEVLMSWLNEYMEAMTQAVLENGGIVDKFIGDCIMAVFGVPIPRTSEAEIAQDAVQAVGCAVEMAHILNALNQKWESQGRPTVSMRVGIATGLVVTGSLGGEQRLDYTTIGDSVNIASRLESFDKTLGLGICRILINENTYNYVQNRFPHQFIANVQLKGRSETTKIYQILLESLKTDVPEDSHILG